MENEIMEILITKKAKEQLKQISKKELSELKDMIQEMDYTGVIKCNLENGKFCTVDFYKSKDNNCVIAEFFVHHHENDAYNSYLDFISSRTNDDGTWLI